MNGDFGIVLAWFLVAALIAWLVIFSVKPAFVLKNDGSGEVDPAKVFLAAIIIGIIVALLVWLIRRSYIRY